MKAPLRRHAVGTIRYPGETQPGYVLYLKSSMNGDEPADVRGYAREHATFPHQSTADQFFDPSQFEAYRELGKHIAESALQAIGLYEDGFDRCPVPFSRVIEQVAKVARS